MIDTGKCGAVILAGGFSSRMNYPKSWLILPDGRTFLKRLVDTYRFVGVDQVVVVLNQLNATRRWEEYLDEISTDAKILINSEPKKGRMHSVKLGLKVFEDEMPLFIHNVDSPLTEPETLIRLWENRLEKGVAKPVFNGRRGHPVLIAEDVVKLVRDWDYANHTLRDILKKFPYRPVDVADPQILSNLNTPEAYERLISEFAG